MKSEKFIKVFLLFLIFLFYGLLLSQKVNLTTADLGRHIKSGEIIVSRRSVAQVNLFSYTNPDYPFVNHHWGSGVIFFLVYKLSGFGGVSAFFVLLSLVTFWLFFRIALEKSNFSPVLLCSVFLLPVIASRVEIRPEVFSYLFSGIFFGILSRKKPLFWLPAVMLFWVNLHLYFFLGFFLIAVFVLEELIKRNKKNVIDLVRVFFLSFLAALVNPAGLKGVFYPLTIFRNYGYRLLENQSVWFLDKLIAYPPSIYFKIVFILLIASFIYAFIRKQKISIVNLVLLLLISYLGWTAVRNFTLFGLFALPIMAENCQKLWSKRGAGGLSYLLLANLTFAAGVLLFLIAPRYWQAKADIGLGPKEGSAASAEFFLKQGLKGPVFNNYDIGGYLIYYLYPQEKVFVDNRPEAYPKDFFDNVYIPSQEDEEKWQETEAQYRFNTIFFYRHDLTPWGQSFLIKRVSDFSWAPVYVDDYAIIFLKRNKENEQVIKNFELPKELFQVQKTT